MLCDDHDEDDDDGDDVFVFFCPLMNGLTDWLNFGSKVVLTIGSKKKKYYKLMSFLFLKYCKKSSYPAYNTSVCLQHRHRETLYHNNL